jgi:molybdopterin synthase sulfur carrier subunit
MKLLVQYTGQLRTAVGCSQEEADVAEKSSLADLLVFLASRLHPAARAHLLTDAGRARQSLLLVVNGVAVSATEANGTELQPGDVVTLMPPIAGG